MSKPLFMSPEHVRLMNERLAGDVASKSACAALPRRYQLAYRLEDGERVVWWTTVFDPAGGVRFHLAPPEGDADLQFSGSYWAMIEFTQRSKQGDAGSFPLTTGGDLNTYAIIMPAFAAAQAAATLDTEFPAR
ncbi:MAG TPA: hypothetical protein VHE37_08170 [Nevskiaceae bacterium]|nr:hypothetical protein [Nevskiaceae bacterium]